MHKIHYNTSGAIVISLLDSNLEALADQLVTSTDLGFHGDDMNTNVVNPNVDRRWYTSLQTLAKQQA